MSDGDVAFEKRGVPHSFNCTLAFVDNLCVLLTHLCFYLVAFGWQTTKLTLSTEAFSHKLSILPGGETTDRIRKS